MENKVEDRSKGWGRRPILNELGLVSQGVIRAEVSCLMSACARLLDRPQGLLGVDLTGKPGSDKILWLHLGVGSLLLRVGPWDRTWVVRFCSTGFHTLRHFTSSWCCNYSFKRPSCLCLLRDSRWAQVQPFNVGARDLNSGPQVHRAVYPEATSPDHTLFTVTRN